MADGRGSLQLETHPRLLSVGSENLDAMEGHLIVLPLCRSFYVGWILASVLHQSPLRSIRSLQLF